MPENVMLNHNYVMAEGGTGVRALLAAHMYLSAKAYAAGENGRTENWKFIYETMDAGAEEIEQLQKLVRLDSESEFCDPHYSFHFCRLAEKVKEKLARDNTMSLKKIAPAWYRNGLLLTEEQLERDLLGGYYRDLTLGSVVSSAAMQCALETEEDRNAGFRAIADSVVASNNTYETRVVMVGSGIGGEGRTNLCTHPAMLRKLCVERVMEDLRMEQEQAKAYVEQNLKIAVIMTGSAFRFPAISRRILQRQSIFSICWSMISVRYRPRKHRIPENSINMPMRSSLLRLLRWRISLVSARNTHRKSTVRLFHITQDLETLSPTGRIWDFRKNTDNIYLRDFALMQHCSTGFVHS